MEIHAGSGKTKSEPENKLPQVVYVKFTGLNRVTNTGLPVNVKGWWEIHGLPFETARDVAYALADDSHMSVLASHDMPWQMLPAGCTYTFAAKPGGPLW